ncbi:hypothetical protein WR25_13903 isoform F [Diploscapter pachys]|uniref:Delta-like protein n=1 Tax=Diploscapter pachys TaxID=2018661 RepID=A0A2A2K550_9BILA|nr:hypothetical protein WR25_13903 isoform D [Diploscapter pachys]PAV68993.1 hypothetical protein WR25_13903 isoform F [Diploscapter pachys]
MMFILRLTVIFEVLKTVLSSGFVLMNLTSSEFVMLKLRRLDSQPLSYKLKGNKSLITLPEGKHRLIEFPLAWNDTLSLGFDVFNAEGGLLISLEMHRRPNPHGSDWQKDVFSAKNARIQAVYRYECDKHFYGEKCEVKCKNSLYLPNVLCNSHGKLDCKKGWTGAKCQIKIDPTHCECKNDGICVCENSNIKEIEQQVIRFYVKKRIYRIFRSGLKKMPRCHHIHEDLMEQFLSNHRNQSTEHPFQNLPTKPRSCL